MSKEHEDKHHEHEKRHSDELGDLVRTLIEVQVAGNDLLAALDRKLATTICVLERISENTCETLNKLHELAECKEKEACDPCRPAEVGCAKPPAPPPEKSEPPCRYEPCKPGEEGGGSDVSRSGSTPPQRTFGAPYPPAPPKTGPGRANSVPAPKIPRGPFRGFLTPGDAHAPLDFRSGVAVLVATIRWCSASIRIPASPLRYPPRRPTSAEPKAATSCSPRGTGTSSIRSTRAVPSRHWIPPRSSIIRPTGGSAAIRSYSMFPASTGSSG